MNRRWLLLAVLLPAAWAVALGPDGLPGNDDDESAMELEERLPKKEVRKRLARAVAETDPARKRKGLLAALALLSERGDVVVQPRPWNAFVEAVLTTAAPAGETCLKDAAAGRFRASRTSRTSCQALRASSRLI